jgi:hypothetical protein
MTILTEFRDPQAIASKSTATLAALTNVSEPTVNRFCTGLGASASVALMHNTNCLMDDCFSRTNVDELC